MSLGIVESTSAQKPRCFLWEVAAQAIRVVGTPEQPWFVAKGVCTALGFDNVKGSDNLRSLEADEKGIQVVSTLGGDQEMSVVSESGLYALIFRSRKEQAKLFRKWVTSEVLPQIRKNGHYQTPAVAASQPDVVAAVMPVLTSMASVLDKMVDRMGRLEAYCGPVPLCELTANPSALTERQTSVLHHLEYVARPLVELGLMNEVPVLNALERAGLARKTGMSWGRIRKTA